MSTHAAMTLTPDLVTPAGSDNQNAQAGKASASVEPGFGLAHWMQRVLKECDKAATALDADPVHDLRVALRRCRSMADGWMQIDPNPAWRQMKKAGRKLFRALGELRDVQVMTEWVEKLASPEDAVGKALAANAAQRELELKETARTALQEFDRKRWERWTTVLPKRTARVKLGSFVFRHMALERWTEAYALHQRALRNRSSVAFHELRIGIKRLRYTVENFLPDLHDAWIDDLKDMQDQLGEVHDLDVLWGTAVSIHAMTQPGDRARWRSIVREQRERRIEKYRKSMVGPRSLWQVWRRELPQGPDVQSAALDRLKLWASFLDPDFRRSQHATNLALQIYDELEAGGQLVKFRDEDLRLMLRIAAITHDVGRAKRDAKHHKSSARLLAKMHVPLGLQWRQLHLAAFVTRYHRGRLPDTDQSSFAKLPLRQQNKIRLLAGILRLAVALNSDHGQPVRRIKIHASNECISLHADGFRNPNRLGERLAKQRYLLESVLGKPIVVKGDASLLQFPARSAHSR
jgi:CHAD domain-containing protein